MFERLSGALFALPEPVNDKLNEFFIRTEQWLSGAIELGQQQGDLNNAAITACENCGS